MTTSNLRKYPNAIKGEKHSFRSVELNSKFLSSDIRGLDFGFSQEVFFFFYVSSQLYVLLDAAVPFLLKQV